MISYVSANPKTSNCLEAVSTSTPHFFSTAVEHLREMLFASLGQTLPFFSGEKKKKKKVSVYRYMYVWHVPQSQHLIQGAGIRTPHSVKGPDSTRTVTGKSCVFIRFMAPVVKRGVFNMFSCCTRIG